MRTISGMPSKTRQHTEITFALLQQREFPMKALVAQLSNEEVVALALNEQGFLLQQKLAHVLTTPGSAGEFPHAWHIEGEEIPVSLPNGMETKIDILLGHAPKEKNPWRVILESKRSAPEYKRWIFFGQTDRDLMPTHR